jgi:multiple sugar transport system substrate-binding protein
MKTSTGLQAGKGTDSGRSTEPQTGDRAGMRRGKPVGLGTGVGLTRRRLGGTAAVLGGALGAACGAERAPGQAAGGAGARSAEPVTIQWMTDWLDEGTRGQVVRQSSAAYQARYPRVTVDVRHPATGSTATGSAAIVAHFAAGTIGEVILPSSSVVHALMEQHAFMDISAHLKRARFDKESVWYEGQYVEHQGKVHGLPYQLAVAGWVYNKTWFEREGLTPPTDAWTTADVVEAARKLTRPGENRWGLQLKQEWQWWYGWMYANGADYVSSAAPLKTTLDDPRVVEVLTAVVDMIHRHKVAAPEYGSQKVPAPSFTKGEVAITSNSKPKQMNASVQGQFQWDLMPTPRWAGTRRRVTTWNHQPHMLTRQAEERGKGDAAVEFAAWLCGEEGQTPVAREGGSIPVNKKAAYGPAHLDGNPPGLKLILDMLQSKGDQSARGYRLWSGYSDWLRATNPPLEGAFGGEISVQEAVTRATQAGNAALTPK